MGNFESRTVVITGSGTGLGKAAALFFAKEGAHVVLCGRRITKIEEVRRAIIDSGGKAVAVQCDVSRESDVAKLIRTAVEFGNNRIDVLINNAGVYEAGDVTETSLDSWNDQLKTNLTGAFLTMRASLPIMRSQNYGRIINVTSGLASNGAGGFAAYSAGKAGLEALTRTVADDESNYDILANLFNPGTIRTEMHATGKDPASVIPSLARLASLPKKGISGRIIHADQPVTTDFAI